MAVDNIIPLATVIFSRECQNFLRVCLHNFKRIFCSVHFTQLWLFDFSGWVAWNRCKNDFARTLVLWKLQTEVVYVFFGAGVALFYFDDCGRNFSKSLISKTNNSN